MRIETTNIAGVAVIIPEAFTDERGSFSRIFCRQELAAVMRPGLTIEQMSHSTTVKKGCVRGMHFQLPPHAELKIVKCIKGSVFDVAVDLRQGSPTFLHWYGLRLTAENMKALIVPEGCAHGFQTLEDNVELVYMTTAAYCVKAEGSLRYDEPRVGITWPEPISLISAKDASQPWLLPDFHGIAL